MTLTFVSRPWGTKATATTAEQALDLSVATLSDGLRPWVAEDPGNRNGFLIPELPFDTTTKPTIFNVTIGDSTIAEWYGIEEGPTALELVNQIEFLLEKLRRAGLIL